MDGGLREGSLFLNKGFFVLPSWEWGKYYPYL